MKQQRHKEPPPLRQSQTPPLKDFMLALALLIFASVFFSIGFTQLKAGEYFLCVLNWIFTVIVLLPGSYHMFLYIQISRGAPGYDITMLTELNYQFYFRNL